MQAHAPQTGSKREIRSGAPQVALLVFDLDGTLIDSPPGPSELRERHARAVG